MQMSPKVSILVPIYNVENFIEKCLRSIFEQSYANIEYVLFNDCTPDKSMLIVNKVADEYTGIKDKLLIVNNSKKGGVSNARNRLLEHASGDYILFVDSDDFCEKDMVKKLVEKAVDEDADIIICDFYGDYPDKQDVIKQRYKNQENYLHDMICGKWAVVWNKLIRKSLLTDKGIRFPHNINGGEDYCFVAIASYYAKHIGFISQPLYHHVNYNTSSIMKSASYNSLYDQVLASEYMSAFLCEKADYYKYKQDINERKLQAKNKLLLYAINQWNSTFPESNYTCFSYRCNWKQKLKYIGLMIMARLLK